MYRVCFQTGRLTGVSTTPCLHACPTLSPNAYALQAWESVWSCGGGPHSPRGDFSHQLGKWGLSEDAEDKGMSHFLPCRVRVTSSYLTKEYETYLTRQPKAR